MHVPDPPRNSRGRTVDKLLIAIRVVEVGLIRQYSGSQKDHSGPVSFTNTGMSLSHECTSRSTSNLPTLYMH